MKVSRGSIIGALGLVLTSTSVFADSQWNVTFFLEPNLAQAATQGICLQSNHQWYSTTFPNWRGDWLRKGDRFRWYGRTGSSLATGEFGQIFSPHSVSGEFAHWRAAGSSIPPLTSSVGSWIMTLVNASRCDPPFKGSAPAGKQDPSE